MTPAPHSDGLLPSEPSARTSTDPARNRIVGASQVPWSHHRLPEREERHG
ncbi:hypothetical protein [Nocardiopsis sp. B62]|nr:hypothetical protein [Nocardiopsis sp. B62]MBQ1082483.1 hypothetical protein [Nocardiopsis sp. B62]